MSSAFGNVRNPRYLGQTSVLKNKATQQTFQAGLCRTLFALVRWNWLLKTTYSKPCSCTGAVASAGSWVAWLSLLILFRTAQGQTQESTALHVGHAERQQSSPAPYRCLLALAPELADTHLAIHPDFMPPC